MFLNCLGLKTCAPVTKPNIPIFFQMYAAASLLSCREERMSAASLRGLFKAPYQT